MRQLYYFLLICIFLVPSTFVSAQKSTTSQVVINRVETKEKVVALTFDADMTPHMLSSLKKKKVSSWYNKEVIDILEKEKVPATLFLTGMWVKLYPDVTKTLSDNPLFEIGNHSYSHPGFSSPCYKLATIDESKDVFQISQTEKIVSQTASHHSLLFRFPGLCYDTDDVQAATSLGYTIIGGDVLGDDGFQKDAAVIVSHVVSSVRPGSIVVLHMMGGPNAPHTADALPGIIEKLRKEGYTFVTVSDLLQKEKIH